MPSFVTAFFFGLLFSLNLLADESVPAKPVDMTVQTLKIENKVLLAISFQNFKEWHTYWKNPGDAGLGIKNQFSLNKKELKLTEEEWPTPKRFIENGTQWAYGYINGYTLFYRLEKADLNKLSGKNIELTSSWLVCKHICVPGQKQLSFKLAGEKIENLPSDLLSPLSDSELTARYLNLPKAIPLPDYLEIKLSRATKEKTLVLSYMVKNTTDVTFLNNANLLYAFPTPPFDFGHENLIVKDNSLSGIVEVLWDGEYSSPPEPLPANGKFKKPYRLKFLFNDPVTRNTEVIEKTFTSFDLSPVTAPLNSETPTPPTTDSVKTGNTDSFKAISSAPSNNSLFYYMVLAFVGGLILNIMPCVLPVISLKLFGLVKYQNQSRQKIMRHNFFYTLGILFTFIVLASVVLIMKSIGTEVGWGFQLQSPNFIAVMIIVLFIFSLNLFGMFEFATPGGRKLGNIHLEDSFAGDFFSGILATILSTPCSAPFLGTALTFAFTSSATHIFSVFLMIGLGLAFPFIMTGFVPGLVTFIPRPGQWMNKVKKLLGITLLLTIIWLFDVYIALVEGQAHFAKLGSLLVFIFLGISIRKRKEKWFSKIAYLLALALFVNMATTTVIASKEEQTALIRDKKAQGLNWEPWSYDKMKEYKETHEVVFIDFTAKWCFTCKINEKLVLDTGEFKQFVTDNNIKLLIGDWTKRDEIIGEFLRSNGLVGVPAYFVQKKDGTLVGLGETVTIDRIKEHLK